MVVYLDKGEVNIMKLSAKDKILVAIYIEYQKDIPDMDEAIKMEKLNLYNDEYLIGISKLENEGLINGARLIYGDDCIIMAIMDDVMPSVCGLRYVEEKLLRDNNIGEQEDDPESGNLRKVIRNATHFGWNEIKDIAARTLAEIYEKING
jgi:hypothetical protein